MGTSRRLLWLLGGLAAIVALVVAAPAVAHDDPVHPVHSDDPTHPDRHGDCWDVAKTAKDTQGNPITELTLSLGQSYTISYEIVVTERDCEVGETPHESVDIKDSYAGTLAIHLAQSATFRYTREVTARTCDSFDVENTAEVWNAVMLTSASATVRVNVACQTGCTLTQGYWKTHSEQGPAPYDNTWEQLENGASEMFFKSGQTWYQVFWTPPAGGNVYYQLAHQYMAAVLNKLNGASSTAAVDAAIASATTFFNTYTPAEAGAFGKSSTLRKDAGALASTLGSYNEGAIGPGHCDE